VRKKGADRVVPLILAAKGEEECRRLTPLSGVGGMGGGGISEIGGKKACRRECGGGRDAGLYPLTREEKGKSSCGDSA